MVSTSRDYVFQAIHFERGSSTLRTESVPLLDALARWMRDDPQTLGVLHVSGHAALGEPRAADLSAARAEAVERALRERGVPPGRLSSRGYAAHCPIESNATDGAREKNRRVDFQVLQTAAGETDIELGCAATRQLPLAAAGRKARSAVDVDTRDWMQDLESPLVLRWTYDQSRAVPPLRGVDDDLTKHQVPLQLTMTRGAVEHTLTLRSNGAQAWWESCAALRFFYAGRLLGFELERLASGRVLISRTLQDEGRDPSSTPLFVMSVPPSAEVSGTVVQVAPDGTRHERSCVHPAR